MTTRISRSTTRPAVAEARRIVRRAPPARNYYNEVIEQLKLIADLEVEQSDLDRRRKEVEERIQKLMIEGTLQEADDGALKAEYKPTTGRSSTDIDPLKFMKFLGKDREAEFWSCVKIGVSEAKQFITDREISKVGTFTPAVAGPAKLTVTRKKKSK